MGVSTLQPTFEIGLPRHMLEQALPCNMLKRNTTLHVLVPLCRTLRMNFKSTSKIIAILI
jgi:hypothetical protein